MPLLTFVRRLFACLAVLAALAAIDPDTLSPREALDHLYQLKKLALKS